MALKAATRERADWRWGVKCLEDIFEERIECSGIGGLTSFDVENRNGEICFYRMSSPFRPNM